VDSGFDENQPELGIAVLAIALQVLANADCLLDLQQTKINVFISCNTNTNKTENSKKMFLNDMPSVRMDSLRKVKSLFKESETLFNRTYKKSTWNQ